MSRTLTSTRVFRLQTILENHTGQNLFAGCGAFAHVGQFCIAALGIAAWSRADYNFAAKLQRIWSRYRSHVLHARLIDQGQTGDIAEK